MGSCSTDTNAADEECWICLSGPGHNGPSLSSYCGCKMRVAHGSCIIRWQLAQLERSADTHCRFCGQGPWEATISSLPRAPPLIKVEFGNKQSACLTVRPGPAGRREFQDAVCRLYNVHPEEELLVSFQSHAPVLPHETSPTFTAGRGHEVALEGWNSFDTVVVLAQVQAAARLQGRASSLPPLPPVMLPSVNSTGAGTAPALAAEQATRAHVSSQSAAAIANLGLQLPMPGPADFSSHVPEADAPAYRGSSMTSGEGQPHASSSTAVGPLLGWRSVAARRTTSARTSLPETTVPETPTPAGLTAQPFDRIV